MSESEVMFSVILATRNRPSSCRVALQSILKQTFGEIEVIVVNDGSAEDHLPAYRALEQEAGGRVRFLKLQPRPSGHGQSYARNFGASWARGRYVCFLDDDDVWTDQRYLECARDVIERSEERVDLHLANQAAFLGDSRQEGPFWIECLADILRTDRRQADALGAYTVTVDDLLKCSGFCHLNATIVRREFFEDIGGLDESQRYEDDRDFYLRAIDGAALIKYSPRVVSRHNIFSSAGSSVAAGYSILEKRIFQLRVFDRAILFANHPGIRAHGRLHKAYALKSIAEELAKAGRLDDALYYARVGLGARPTWKWLGYTAWQIVIVMLAHTRSWVRLILNARKRRS